MKKAIFFFTLMGLSLVLSAQSIGLSYIPGDGMNLKDNIKGYSLSIESPTADLSVNGKYKKDKGYRIGLSVHYLESLYHKTNPTSKLKQLYFSGYLQFFLWRGTRCQIPVGVGISYGSVENKGTKDWKLGGSFIAQLKIYVSDRIAAFAKYNFKITPMDLNAVSLDNSILNSFLELGIMFDLGK